MSTNKSALLFLVLAMIATILTVAVADSDFSVSSTSTESVDSSTNHVSYVKQWTLTTSGDSDDDNDDDDDSDSDDGDRIDSIKLQLPGRVFISYVSGMPSGVLGYVNVSGDSQSVVETVKVDDSDDDDELEVKFDQSSSSVSGYLLTEIFLSTSNIVEEVEIEKTAEVVIEDGVLIASNTNKEVQVKVSDSSVVYVSSSAMTLQDLKLELSDSATLQLVTDSLTIREDGQFQAHDSSSLKLITSSLVADDLDLDAESSGLICISASVLTASSYDGSGASQISLPNASSKYTSTGTAECTETSTPAREPGCVSSSNCSTTSASSTSTTAPTATTSSTTTTSSPSTSSTTTSSSAGVKTTESNAASLPSAACLLLPAILLGLL